MKEVIKISTEELKKPRRRWIRKPQTQILPRKRKPSRRKEKQSLKEMLKERSVD